MDDQLRRSLEAGADLLAGSQELPPDAILRDLLVADIRRVLAAKTEYHTGRISTIDFDIGEDDEMQLSLIVPACTVIPGPVEWRMVGVNNPNAKGE